MPYKIQYAPEAVHKYPQKKTSPSFRLQKFLLILFFLSVPLLIHFVGIPDFLIPGDPEITRAATAGMIEQISHGVPVKNAITAFCIEILDGAQYETIH